MVKKKTEKKKSGKKKSNKDLEKIPTLKLKKETDIAEDFAVKVYKKFDKLIKSIVLFGSAAKQNSVVGSDIDIILILDDVSIQWDQELIAWYREELDKIVQANPYNKSLHINTIKLSTWWKDLMRGDPTILNILRYGEEIIDMAGFFTPQKFLLLKGEIRATPEAIHSCLQRVPGHIYRSKLSELNAIEGLYWAMVDSAHAALIAANVSPPSPEHISGELEINFVNKGALKSKYVQWYKELLKLHKDISHGKISDLKGVEIDKWQEKTEEFTNIMIKLVKELIS
ncbi:nucleotidyltransferase domain-containing protein [Candidatus Pacearchaeota archaeon]|nr:nucleotidyltransferase domain-containing protein [Candidatus Pacearchaeota archaeon]